jgi:hypothetical protein
VSELLNILSRLKTSKTFYAALLAIAGAAQGFLAGKLTIHQAAGLAIGGALAIGIRDAIAKVEQLAGVPAADVPDTAVLVPTTLPGFMRTELTKLGVDPSLVEQAIKNGLKAQP